MLNVYDEYIICFINLYLISISINCNFEYYSMVMYGGYTLSIRL